MNYIFTLPESQVSFQMEGEWWAWGPVGLTGPARLSGPARLTGPARLNGPARLSGPERMILLALLTGCLAGPATARPFSWWPWGSGAAKEGAATTTVRSPQRTEARFTYTAQHPRL